MRLRWYYVGTVVVLVILVVFAVAVIIVVIEAVVASTRASAGSVDKSSRRLDCRAIARDYQFLTAVLFSSTLASNYGVVQ